MSAVFSSGFYGADLLAVWVCEVLRWELIERKKSRRRSKSLASLPSISQLVPPLECRLVSPLPQTVQGRAAKAKMFKK